MPTHRLLLGYSNLKRSGAYLTHFVYLLSFPMSKQHKSQWCEAKWFAEEIWYSLVHRNYIVQISVIGLVFCGGLGPCGYHKLLGLWHLTRRRTPLKTASFSWLHCRSVSPCQPFLCRFHKHLILA